MTIFAQKGDFLPKNANFLQNRIQYTGGTCTPSLDTSLVPPLHSCFWGLATLLNERDSSGLQPSYLGSHPFLNQIQNKLK